MTVVRASVLGAILAIAAALRLTGIWQRGFIYWDEGKFALEGIRMAALLRSLTGAHWTESAGKTIGTAKPTHALLVGVVDLILGVHDYSSLYVAAITGLACVVLAYAIGRALFDPPTGLLAALFLAVSEYEVVYARSGLSESDGNALFLAGVLVWLLGLTRGQDGDSRQWMGVWQTTTTRVAAGGLLGLAFTANYRMIVYCFVVVAIDIVYSGKSLPGRLHSASLWVGSLAIAPALWQAVDLLTRARGIELFRSEMTGRPMFYLQEAVFQLHGGEGSAFRFSPLQYLQWYVWREGIALSILILVGIIVAIIALRVSAKEAWRHRILVALVVIPYLVYVFAPYATPRNLDATVPFACIVAASGLLRVARSLPRPRSALGVGITIGCLISAGELAASWQLTSIRSGFADAATFIERHGGYAVVTNEVMRFYFRGTGQYCTVQFAPLAPAELQSDVAGGYAYAVIDQYNRKASRYIAARMPVVARYRLGATGAFGEDLISSENGNTGDLNDPNDYVSIYRLRASLLPAGPGVPPPPCDRNGV